MKEIDFLPKWYKSNKKRQIGYRRQYIILGCIFVIMLIWNFVALRSVSHAEAKLARNELQKEAMQTVAQEFAAVKNEIALLKKKADVLAEIDSRIDVASVVAEISFLVGERIALAKVELLAESFAEDQKTNPSAGSAVRTAAADFSGGDKTLTGSVRFKVVLNGLAADAGDVAAFICRMEDSSYFKMVYPSFSRNRKLQTAEATAEESYQLTEFEISCYLANYK